MNKSISDSRSAINYSDKISEVSFVQLAQTNERTAKVVVDNIDSNPFQTCLCGIHNDNDVYAPIEKKLQRMMGSTPLWQTRMQARLKNISKYMGVVSLGIFFVV